MDDATAKMLTSARSPSPSPAGVIRLKSKTFLSGLVPSHEQPLAYVMVTHALPFMKFLSQLMINNINRSMIVYYLISLKLLQTLLNTQVVNMASSKRKKKIARK